MYSRNAPARRRTLVKREKQRGLETRRRSFAGDLFDYRLYSGE
jgi:hypothetical protein